MQQPYVTMNGSDYEFDPFDRQYHCLHSDYTTETVEVDTMRNGEHDTYEASVKVCTNPECKQEIEE